MQGNAIWQKPIYDKRQCHQPYTVILDTKSAISKAIVAATLYIEGELSVKEIAEHLRISKSTLYKYLRYRNIDIGKYTKSTP